MKKITVYLYSFLFLIGLMCSCSSAPEYGKMVPKDAFFVMSVNVEDAVESFDLGEAEALRQQLDESLAQAKLPQDSREQLESIIKDPQNSGFDLRKPILVFASANFINKFGVLGAVNDQDKLEDFLTILSKEGTCTQVLEVDGLRYCSFDKVVLAFNNQWFFLTERVLGQPDEKSVLKEVRLLAEQTEENSLQSNEVFKEMTKREGFMHTLFLGEGLEHVLKQMNAPYEQMMQTLPAGVHVADFALVCDVVISDGEFKVVSEAMPLNDAADDWLDEVSYYGNLKGALADFIPANSLFYGMANFDGEAWIEDMKKNPQISAVLQQEPERIQPLMNFFSALDGDAAFVVDKKMTAAGVPEMAFYANVENTDWLKSIDEKSVPGLKKIDDRTFSIDIPDYRYTANGSSNPALATVIFGAKKDVAYLLVGDKSRVLDKVVDPVKVDSRYNAYVRLSADELLNFEWLKKQLGTMRFVPFKMIVKLFDYAEITIEDGRKSTMRLVMKNKEQSPVRTIYDEVEKGLQLLSM